MIARRSVCATSKLELIDLIETGLGPDLFDRNIGSRLSELLGKFHNVQTLKYWSICHWHSHVNTVFLEGQKGKTGQNRTRSMMRIL